MHHCKPTDRIFAEASFWSLLERLKHSVKDLEEEHHTIYNMAELEKNNPSNKGARIPTVVVTPTND
jgi:hypothetical protein